MASANNDDYLLATHEGYNATDENERDAMADAAEDLEGETVEHGTSADQVREASVPIEDYLLEDEPVASSSTSAALAPAPSGKAKAKPKKSSTTKPKPKPKAKPSTKSSAKPTQKAVAQLKSSTSSTRGRSASETPGPSTVGERSTPAPTDAAVEEDVEEEEDTKLYCVCRTLYDDEKIMIACDKCDEWYHPSCVSLSETQVELVDTFFCPLCVAVDGSLATSYKPVCARPACTHPARPPRSRYCSQECGLRTVMARVEAWGGDTDRLAEHPSVANAQPIEGLRVPDLIAPPTSSSAQNGTTITPNQGRTGNNEEIHRQLAQINEEIQRISSDRDVRDKLRQAVDARVRLLKRAVHRRRSFGDAPQCCFDSRLVYDEDAWEKWLNEGGWDLIQEEADENETGPWYCTQRRRCETHYGWEDIKAADFDLEVRFLSQRLSELAARERDLRLRMENLEVLLQARQTTATLRSKYLPKTTISSDNENQVSKAFS